MGNCPPHNLMEFRTSPVGYTRNSFAFPCGLFELTILDYRRSWLCYFGGGGCLYTCKDHRMRMVECHTDTFHSLYTLFPSWKGFEATQLHGQQMTAACLPYLTFWQDIAFFHCPNLHRGSFFQMPKSTCKEIFLAGGKTSPTVFVGFHVEFTRQVHRKMMENVGSPNKPVIMVDFCMENKVHLRKLTYLVKINGWKIAHPFEIGPFLGEFVKFWGVYTLFR